MKKKPAGRLLLLLLLISALFLLAGCRTRMVGVQPEAGGQETGGSGSLSAAEEAQEQPGQDPVPEGAGEDPEAKTRENPDAELKEYDENAGAEIVEGTGRAVHGEGTGDGAYTETEDQSRLVSKLSDAADRTAVRTVAAGEAEQKGVSDDAGEADSAMTYYTVLLEDRLRSLYECKRLNVYWETEKDHVTVFRRSPEHDLILGSGAYDVSARLTEDRLLVDDGWIGRKNPDVIVKITGSGVLGHGVLSPAAAKTALDALKARPGWEDICAVKEQKVLLISKEMLDAPWLRTAATLIIAKTAYPDLFADADISTALRMLSEEAAGTAPEGIYYYSEQEV